MRDEAVEARNQLAVLAGSVYISEFGGLPEDRSDEDFARFERRIVDRLLSDVSLLMTALEAEHQADQSRRKSLKHPS